MKLITKYYLTCYLLNSHHKSFRVKLIAINFTEIHALCLQPCSELRCTGDFNPHVKLSNQIFVNFVLDYDLKGILKRLSINFVSEKRLILFSTEMRYRLEFVIIFIVIFSATENGCLKRKDVGIQRKSSVTFATWRGSSQSTSYDSW